MIYDLQKPFDRDKFKTRVQQLYKQEKLVELVDRSKRTYRQNNYLHTILSYFALEVGLTLEEVKVSVYKVIVNKDIFCKSVYNSRLGQDVRVIRSSADLTPEEMRLSIERFRNYSSANGIYIPSPDERDYMEQVSLEVEYNKQWL